MRRRAPKKPMPSGASWKGCRAKKRYSNEYEAGLAIKGRQAHGAGALRIYDCGVCGGWHMTKGGE